MEVFINMDYMYIWILISWKDVIEIMNCLEVIEDKINY